MQHALAETEAGVKISGEVVNNLRFADDIDLIAETEEQLQELKNRVNTTSARYGLLINKQNNKNNDNRKIWKPTAAEDSA